MEKISSGDSELISRELPPAEAEKEIAKKEEIDNLPDYEEPGSYYRGLKVEDAFRALFGELKLNADPAEEILGTHDNAALNLHDAIYFSRSSQTKKGEKFFCAIGFNPSPTAKIEESYLKRGTFARITGAIIAKEIILRFAGRKAGQPSPKVKYFSPKEFFNWYKENIS